MNSQSWSYKAGPSLFSNTLIVELKAEYLHYKYYRTLAYESTSISQFWKHINIHL